MSDQRVYLDDIYASKDCEGSVFRAVIMMAQEARFINEQALNGFIQLSKKPTTIAMIKFKEGKLAIDDGKAKVSSVENVVANESVVESAPVQEAAPEVSDAEVTDLF